MEAIIVKDDNFKTIGLEIKEGKNTLFNYGIAPQSWHFCKKVTIDETNISKVMLLIRGAAKLEEMGVFDSNFFSVMQDNELIYPEGKKGINFAYHQYLIDIMKKQIENAVLNFK